MRMNYNKMFTIDSLGVLALCLDFGGGGSCSNPDQGNFFLFSPVKKKGKKE
jgi:hypothetical protein